MDKLYKIQYLIFFYKYNILRYNALFNSKDFIKRLKTMIIISLYVEFNP